MAYTDLQMLRKMIDDQFRSSEDAVVFDGETDQVQLPLYPILANSLTVLIDDVNNTNFTLNAETGLVTFSSLPTKGQSGVFKYQYSAFSDEELTEFIRQAGTWQKARLLCIDCLLVDGAKRTSYKVGNTQIEGGDVFKHLLELRKLYSEESNTPQILSRTNRFYDNEEEELTDLSRADF